ncbi:hypothetical protein INS49_005446 [Diaporthe citri]|uniref:uncharacterized protein n=1 Tax=Diaporthe citri TaxID=83186 RepID=UPI001C817923|nr:uncharacterized protein INS49_005446 [Diaporthe citri]KAG6353737.1 hypothetical protein INS49_005446 [Diaporthe citri]
MSRIRFLWLVAARAPLLDIYRFNTVSTYTTFDQDRDVPSSAASKRDDDVGADGYGNAAVPNYVQVATSQVREVVPNASFRVVDDYYVGTNNVGHVHFQQVIDGIDVDTADFKINILENGTVLSFGHSFHMDSLTPLQIVRRAESTITPLAAFESAVKLLDLIAEVEGPGESYTIKQVEGFVASPTAKLVYVTRDSEVDLAWRIETDIGSNWLISYVDAASGNEIAGVIDYTNTASCEAFPWGTMNPYEGSWQLIANPEDAPSSPFGWHSDGTQNYTTLRGNNAFVTVGGATTNKAVATSPSLVFSYPYSPATANWQTYVNASATQAFYTINKFHDILYALGFDEDAGNFQVSNNGNGGRAGDPVEIIVHSSGGSAMISTPADGSSPRLSMGAWTSGETPLRDSAFDSTVLLHEYMHAVTVRLVGGPATSGCLSGNDGLSLNEDYSDFVPTLLRVKAGDTRSTDYTIADWATGEAIGLRSHYISTSLETTSLTYESLNALASSGGFGLATVWATALYEVFWNLVDTYGIGEMDKVTLGAGGIPQRARYLLLKLILGSDALVPCSPNHLQTRDAILQADRVLTGGTNQCAIWKGFAKRGFGQDAVRGSG